VKLADLAGHLDVKNIVYQSRATLDVSARMGSCRRRASPHVGS
jgi:hypothetical protein